MSKKGKNSNYKNNIGQEAVKTVQAPLSKEQIRNIVIWASAAVLALALIIGLIGCLMPKTKYVEMDFGSYGKIVIEIDEEEAPITAQNFLNLVNSGFYDGRTIFRAQKNFVIQGGKDTEGEVAAIKGEFKSNGVSNSISHKRGVISMARSGNSYNSATSQFFITLADTAAKSLDGNYAGFGYVVEGMEVVDAIANALFGHAIDSMGFVGDADAITIVSAKVIDYKK